MTQAIVFDLFDTLVDLRWEDLPPVDVGEGPKPSTTGALHEIVLARTDLDVGLQEFAAALRTADEGFREMEWAADREIHTEDRFASLLRELGLEDDALARELTDVHMGGIARVSSTPPHHADVLRALRAERPLAICSNFSNTPTARAILEREGLLDLFDVVIVSEDVGMRKPHRVIFERTLEGLGVAADQVLHVGDNLAQDVAGAAPLGIRTAWITRRVPNPGEARARYGGPPPDHVIADLGEIDALLDGR